MIEGKRIRFRYHGIMRTGIVEKVGLDYVVIKHDQPINGKRYSTYRVSRMQSEMLVIS